MEWHKILSCLGEGAVSGVVLFALLVIFWRIYIQSYLTEKGKNLATSQDIKDITEQVEAIKADYARILEKDRATNLLRMAAVERRLEAHQQAYSLWRKLVAYSDPKLGKVVEDCQNWWDQNSLYLSADARQAFQSAYEAAFNSSNLQDCSNSDLIKNNRKIIMIAGPKIVEGVELPSLGDIESKVLGQSTNDS